MALSTRPVLFPLALLTLWLAAACSPKPPTGEEVVPQLDAIRSAVSSPSVEDLIALVDFSMVPCTTGEGLGGAPKCLAGEEEGTVVEVLPFLGPEGHHWRRSELASWQGLRDARLYAAYRTSERTYSDEFYPAGDFGVAFVLPDGVNAVVLQVSDAGIVRVDYTFLDAIDDVLGESEVVLGPIPVSP